MFKQFDPSQQLSDILAQPLGLDQLISACREQNLNLHLTRIKTLPIEFKISNISCEQLGQIGCDLGMSFSPSLVKHLHQIIHHEARFDPGLVTSPFLGADHASVTSREVLEVGGGVAAQRSVTVKFDDEMGKLGAVLTISKGLRNCFTVCVEFNQQLILCKDDLKAVWGFILRTLKNCSLPYVSKEFQATTSACDENLPELYAVVALGKSGTLKVIVDPVLACETFTTTNASCELPPQPRWFYPRSIELNSVNKNLASLMMRGANLAEFQNALGDKNLTALYDFLLNDEAVETNKLADISTTHRHRIVIEHFNSLGKLSSANSTFSRSVEISRISEDRHSALFKLFVYNRPQESIPEGRDEVDLEMLPENPSVKISWASMSPTHVDANAPSLKEIVDCLNITSQSESFDIQNLTKTDSGGVPTYSRKISMHDSWGEISFDSLVVSEQPAG